MLQQLRGHQVVSHTAAAKDGRYQCVVVLVDPFGRQHDLRVFRGRGPAAGSAEDEALKLALQYLDLPGATDSSPTQNRVCVSVCGRLVDIFCDSVGEGKFQAFPFLRRDDGVYAPVMRFHMDESVTGANPVEAMVLCVSRLESHFTGPGVDER